MLLHPDRVVHEGPASPQALDRAVSRSCSEATGSGRRAAEREARVGLPADLVVVDVEVEVRDGEGAVEAESSSKARSSSGSPRWWATVTCGWNGNVELVAQRAAAYGGGELLAARDALGDGHEDDRRDGAEGAGTAQVHAETAPLTGHGAAAQLVLAVKVDPLVMNGEPFLYGTRLTVRQLLELRRNGYTLVELLKDHPELRVVGVAAAFTYAGDHRADYREFFDADGSLTGPGYTEAEAESLPDRYRIPGIVIKARSAA